jgi:hypothetical protein
MVGNQEMGTSQWPEKVSHPFALLPQHRLLSTSSWQLCPMERSLGKGSEEQKPREGRMVLRVRQKSCELHLGLPFSNLDL